MPAQLEKIQKEIPFGIPSESIEMDGKGSTWCISDGADKWYKLFTQRQLLSLFVLVRNTRQAFVEMDGCGYDDEWKEAIISYLASAIDRVADYNSTLCYWRSSEFISHTFQRFALPIAWDFCEVPVISSQTGGYLGAVDWIARYVDHALRDLAQVARPNVILRSAIEKQDGEFDLVLTDPPYYNAIAYSNLMDFFYVWEKRTLFGFFSNHDSIYNPIASPKWSHEKNDGELVDDPCRFGGDRDKSKANYEDGMFRAFQSCHDSLAFDGRIVIVFAHKQPEAWESLVSAIIRSGFCVLCSWPIQTEMGSRTRALSSSALASSIWLVCGKRRSDARPGWDNQRMEDMRSNIASRLRDYWDAGVRWP